MGPLILSLYILFGCVLVSCFVTLSLLKRFMDISKNKWENIDIKIQHLYGLCDLLSVDRTALQREFYLTIRNSDPSEAAKMLDTSTMSEFTNKIGQYLSKQYEDVIKSLQKKLEDTQDPLEKEKLQAHMREIQHIMSMISSVDENSSYEYVEQVYEEIRTSIKSLGLIPPGPFEPDPN